MTGKLMQNLIYSVSFHHENLVLITERFLAFSSVRSEFYQLLFVCKQK